MKTKGTIIKALVALILGSFVFVQIKKRKKGGGLT